MERHWFGQNRTMCDVLEDMRRCDKTRSYTLLAGLIEESQIMANRMEAALSDQKDLIKLSLAVSEGRKEFNKLNSEIEVLKGQLPESKGS